MRLNIIISLLLLLYSFPSMAKILVAIPEPARKIVNLEQLKNIGFISELGPEVNPTETRWLSFRIPELEDSGSFKYAKVKLLQGQFHIASYEMDIVTMNNIEYATTNINTSVVTDIIVEFRFENNVVIEATISVGGL